MKNFKKFIKEAHLGNPLNEEDRATRVDKMLSGEYEDEDYKDSKRYDDVRAELEDEINEENEKYDHIARAEYGKPFSLLSIAQKQEMLSYMNRETEKEFETDFERRRKGDLDDEYDGMTDYQRRRMDENMGEWPKELTSRYSDEYRFELEKVSPTYQDKPGRAKYRVIDIESGELKGTPVFGKPESLMAYADDLIKPQGGTQSTNLGESLDEDINDPVLMKTRAAQMKRDAMDKKDLENKSKRISADEAIDLRYELSILDNEREDVLMRIEDIGVEMEQTAEPEGGPIADKLGERLMRAEKELRAINNQIIDIKDDLGIFDMNESDLNEIGIGSEYFFQVNNDQFKKEVDQSENYNDFEKRVYGIIGPDNFKMAKITDPDAMKNYYDGIRGNRPKFMEEELFTPNEMGDEAVEKESNSAAYESLQESLRKKLRERLK